MKQFVVAATIFAITFVSVAVAESAPRCMYCKRNDENSGFLNSWSYCKEYDTCLHNEWNYISARCPDGDGW